MERRTFLALVPGCLLAAPLVSEAQQSRAARIGYLAIGTATTNPGLRKAFIHRRSSCERTR
jgi:hypothetical protein